jgi:CRISPR-associated endonuclease/helicase Cas3
VDAGSAHPVAPEKLGEQFVVLSNPDLYRKDAGLDWDDPTFRSAESLVR